MAGLTPAKKKSIKAATAATATVPRINTDFFQSSIQRGTDSMFP
jgi:hypothetical protein